MPRPPKPPPPLAKMELPLMVTCVEVIDAGPTVTPEKVLYATILPAPGLVPPIVPVLIGLERELILIPLPVLPSGLPVAVTPIKLAVRTTPGYATDTPPPLLLLITLPLTVASGPSMITPPWSVALLPVALGMAAVSAALVPIRLSRIAFAAPWKIRTPAPVPPLITLPAPLVVPPMVLLEPVLRLLSLPLPVPAPAAVVPAALVPTQLPSTGF